MFGYAETISVVKLMIKVKDQPQVLLGFKLGTPRSLLLFSPLL